MNPASTMEDGLAVVLATIHLPSPCLQKALPDLPRSNRISTVFDSHFLLTQLYKVLTHRERVTQVSCWVNVHFDSPPLKPWHFWMWDWVVTSSGFPGGSSGKESTCQCRRCKRPGFHPWVGKTPGEGNGNPLQYSWPGNPKKRGARWATVHEATKELDTT